jgi:hypothetical protein
MRDEIGLEDGPADIVFGPDFFDPRINGRAPYWEGILKAIKEERLKIDDRPLTEDDLGKSAAELFPGVPANELPNRMLSLLAQVEPIGSDHH